jgi:hypothetical protein
VLRTGFLCIFTLLQCAYLSLDTHPTSGLECCRSSSCRAEVGVSAVKRRRKQETRGGESKRRKVEALGAALSSFGAVEVNAESQRHTVLSATTTNSIVRKTPRACTSWTSNESQNLNQGRSADPELCPVVPYDQTHFLQLSFARWCALTGAYRSELRRRCCASRVLSAQKKSLREAYDLSLRRR